MQSSGDAEFSGEKKDSTNLTLTFWQSFLLTLSGAAGLISMVTDGPLWISIVGFTFVIVLMFWLVISQQKKRKK